MRYADGGGFTAAGGHGHDVAALGALRACLVGFAGYLLTGALRCLRRRPRPTELPPTARWAELTGTAATTGATGYLLFLAITAGGLPGPVLLGRPVVWLAVQLLATIAVLATCATAITTARRSLLAAARVRLAQGDAGSASRGETPAADDDQEQPVPAVPADTEPARPGPAALPRQPDAGPLGPPPEPYLRGLGRFDLIRNISSLMGESGWDLAGWTRAPGLFYVRKAGRALAWIEHGAGPCREPHPAWWEAGCTSAALVGRVGALAGLRSSRNDDRPCCYDWRAWV
ncbi:hypothetical protein ACIRYZ_41955 [Kitasatospora sp. NPDC101155]|uniref:hypothetical protein n=1 Tax=Kitasatospora sp. NPDC101155 TaxID=3364097 RepID=UPI0038083A64